MTKARNKAWLPPRWFIKTFWRVHRRIVRASNGGKGLWLPRAGKWGALRLTTTGRRSGEPRSVILGYYEDGPNVVSMAMNGWGAAEPAWWLNLQANPKALVELAGGTQRKVLARPALGAERERLWQRWRELDKNLDSYAARRPHETAVVVLEPRATDAFIARAPAGGLARGSPRSGRVRWPYRHLPVGQMEASRSGNASASGTGATGAVAYYAPRNSAVPIPNSSDRTRSS